MRGETYLEQSLFATFSSCETGAGKVCRRPLTAIARCRTNEPRNRIRGLGQHGAPDPFLAKLNRERRQIMERRTLCTRIPAMAVGIVGLAGALPLLVEAQVSGPDSAQLGE